MTRARHHPIIVFADGACSGNPGPGGWGAIIATPDGAVTELGGRVPDTTNNQMELTAVGKALRHLEETPGEIHVYTDSYYVINGVTKWVWGWRKNGWKTKEGGEVANVEYWKRLLAILGRRREGGDPVEWKYVRGHSGVPGNERVDAIATGFARGPRPSLYAGPLLRYDVPVFDVPEDAGEPPPPSAARLARKAKAPAYSYLSLVGATAERHSSWAECERRVKGVARAKFKRCADVAEEARVLASWGARLRER